MKLSLQGNKCICGKEIQLHNLNHAMCAACGLVFFYIKISCLVLMNAIMSGKKWEIARTIQIFSNPITNSI